MRMEYGRPPLSLRLSVTDRCSLRCAYCMPATGAPNVASAEMLSFEAMVNFVCLLKERYQVGQVRLTGGEPLLRPKIEELVSMFHALGVSDLALTTNGQQLAELAGPLRRAGLQRINISLDSLNPEKFTSITRGGILGKTLAGIVAARRAGLHPIKLNTVVMRGQNDREVADLVRFAMDYGCQLRFLELMPIGVAATEFEDHFVSSAEVGERLSRKFTLTALPVDPQDTSRNFEADDERGRTAIIGFISPYSEPFCAGCWRLRLTSTGVLMGCLARPGGIPLASLLRARPKPDADALVAAVEEALSMKRRNGEFIQPRAMVGIGG